MVRIIDSRTGGILAGRARICDSAFSRFCGLMLRASLPEDEGIVLSPCGSVHMALMRFSIDVLYLDRAGRVVKLVRRLRPYRVSFGGRHAHSAIEIPSGSIERLGVLEGDEIRMEDTADEALGR
jgi:uncharacterized membrane protein (UPF0127 family)